VLGESEKKTNAILDATLGCVLVIDEAYGLHPKSKSADPYKVLPFLYAGLVVGCMQVSHHMVHIVADIADVVVISRKTKRFLPSDVPLGLYRRR
jgi:hypothetical protein